MSNISYSKKEFKIQQVVSFQVPGIELKVQAMEVNETPDSQI